MNKKEALTLAKEIVSCITSCGSPGGSGYFIIAQHDYYDDDTKDYVITLQVAIEVCKYKDDADGRLYYGVYSVPEVCGGDNIADSDWTFTEHCRVKEVADIIYELEKTFTQDYLWLLYTEGYGI